MSNDNDEGFEHRLRHLLEKTGEVAVPPLSTERMDSLRALVPQPPHRGYHLELVWKKAADKVNEFLEMVQCIGLHTVHAPQPIMRDGQVKPSKADMVSMPLPGGELLVGVESFAQQRARLVLSVKGDLSFDADLSVELSLGQRLIEARPLEQKVEFPLTGTGDFTITLFSGDAVLGEMALRIGEQKAGDDE